jgi:hypothetical protein
MYALNVDCDKQWRDLSPNDGVLLATHRNEKDLIEFFAGRGANNLNRALRLSIKLENSALVDYLYEKVPDYPLKSFRCTIAAVEAGNFGLFIRFVNDVDRIDGEYFGRGGNVDIVKYYLEKNGDDLEPLFFQKMYREAAFACHHDILVYLDSPEFDHVFNGRREIREMISLQGLMFNGPLTVVKKALKVCEKELTQDDILYLLDGARLSGNLNVVSYIMDNYVDLNDPELFNRLTSDFCFTISENPDVVKYLQEIDEDFYRSRIHIVQAAASHGYLNVVKMFASEAAKKYSAVGTPFGKDYGTLSVFDSAFLDVCTSDNIDCIKYLSQFCTTLDSNRNCKIYQLTILSLKINGCQEVLDLLKSLK